MKSLIIVIFFQSIFVGELVHEILIIDSLDIILIDAKTDVESEKNEKEESSPDDIKISSTDHNGPFEMLENIHISLTAYREYKVEHHIDIPVPPPDVLT